MCLGDARWEGFLMGSGVLLNDTQPGVRGMLSFIAFADFFGVSLPTWLRAGYQCDIAELGVGKICAAVRRCTVFQS